VAILNDILAIKEFRENKSEMSVRKQRIVLTEAVTEREAAQERLEQHREFAQRRELELFDELCTRLVVLRDIQDVQATVSELKGQTFEHVKLVESAETTREEETVELDERKAHYREASRLKQKFVELVHVHTLERLHEFERKEDAEMEEVAETRRDRADWGVEPEDAE
jgi:type III secretion protein O